MPIKKKKEESQEIEKKVKNLSKKEEVEEQLEIQDISTSDFTSPVNDMVDDMTVEEEFGPEISENKDEDSVVKRESYKQPIQHSGYGGYNYNGSTIKISGMLEILTDYGVIRQTQVKENGDDLPKDVYISNSQIKRFGLRMGDVVTGLARPPKENERYLSLLKIETVAGEDPEKAKKRPYFAKLTPIFPNEWLKLETKQDVISTRLIDLISPIGKGQRAMIVAPPKAGKTFLLLDIANGITTNYPDITLLVALIGERPEEVTHFARSIKGEVFASNFDEKAEEQTRISELCLEKAKRLAEVGKDVVILMDSITRLARAYNMVAPPSGRTLTGGFDPAALYPAKHFFGAARNLENSGSLTIIATALVDTGSRMDDVIFEEFKGTGNMELRLDRSLSERRIFPAIDIVSSGTRHEEDLLGKEMLNKIYRLRTYVSLPNIDKDATPLVIDQLKKTKDNKEFLDTMNRGGA
ncbi:MAG TPA: transcription termination factor Rho [bacterium]|nr:transcription termination factor Rho [Patescibacteria group bacterium]HNU76574.1 transcription termination factor Rho [bacterium]